MEDIYTTTALSGLCSFEHVHVNGFMLKPLRVGNEMWMGDSRHSGYIEKSSTDAIL
jgi:hypothetical protein